MRIQPLALIVSLNLVSVSAFAANDSFIGNWKFDPQKSQLSGIQYKIEDAGGGKHRFIFGDDVEVLNLDGKDHLTKFGNTWAIKPTGPNTWESVTKRDGKITAKSKWTISADGKKFTSIDDNMRPDGSVGRTEAVLKRTGGTSGLDGTWESTSIKVLSPWSIEVASWKGDGYSLINPAQKERLDFKVDGKNYMPNGPRVAKGTTVTAKKVDDRTIDLIYRLKGKNYETDRWSVSANGKTLTQIISYAGVNKPEVDVYIRR